MSDEATIRSSLEIVNGNLQYRSYPTDFNGDVTGNKGPSPGALTVTVYGESVTFSELTTPGYCRIMNQDDSETVDIGMYDVETDKFYPIFEVRAGEIYVVRLSSLLGNEYPGVGTGTGTSGATTNLFHLRSRTTDCIVTIEAFET